MYKYLFLLFGFTILLLNANAQKPVLVIPSEANAKSTTFQITANAKYVLIAYKDKSIKVYDFINKKLVFTFLEHIENVNSIAIAPDNRTVVSADDAGEILCWNLNTGKLIKKVKAYFGSALQVQISYLLIANKGTEVFVSGLNGVVVCYDILTWKEKYVKKYKSFPITKIDYGQTGKYLLSSSGYHDKLDSLTKINLINAKTGEQLRNIGVLKAALAAAILSKDEKSIYYVTRNKFEFRKYDIETGNYVMENVFPTGFDPKDILELPDQKFLIACKEGNFLTFFVYSLKEHKILYTIRTKDVYIPYFNEHLTFYVNADQTISYLYKDLVNLNVNTGKLSRLDLGLKRFNMKVEVSEDHLLFIENKNALKKWDFKKNELTEVYKDNEGLYSFKEFDSLIVIQKANKVVLWDKKNNNIRKEISMNNEDFNLHFYANENQTLLAIHQFQTDNIAIYKLSDGSFLKSINLPKYKTGVGILKWFGNDVIATSNYETGESDKIFLYNVNSQISKQLNTKRHEDFVKLNDSILIVGEGKNVKLFNINANNFFKEVKLQKPNYIKYLDYDKRANQIIVSTDEDVLLINPSTLVLEKTLIGHRNEIIGVKFNENRDKIFAVSSAYSIKVWDRKTGVLEGTLSLMDQNNWVVTGKNDLFDSSPMAMKQLYYVVNDSTDKEEPWKVIGIDQLKHRYYQPGLLQIQMGLSKEQLRTVPSLNLIELSPKLKGSIFQNQLQIELNNQRGGIGKVAIFINDAEVIADARPNGSKDQNLSKLKVNIDLNNFKSRFVGEDSVMIKVIAWNGGNWLSSRPEMVKYNIPTSKGVTVTNNSDKKLAEKPRLFALVFGTSDYSGTQIDLRYSSKDATDFASALKMSSQKLFGINEVEVSLFSSDEKEKTKQPEKINLISKMEDLAKRIKPSDILVVYLSGHGVNFGGADGDFYYLTKEAMGADAVYLNDPAVRKTAAVSSAELTGLLNKITARKKMLILDACASGKAAETMLVAARDVPASQVRALDRMKDRTGFYILSGSASDAVSYESSVYGQGLLTYSLLKAMRGAALRIDGGEEYIDIQKLFQYAVEEVPKLAAGIGGIQKPLYRSPDNQQSFDIGKSDELTKQAIILAEPKPVFVAVGLQDPLELFDKLNLSEKINAAIRENTAKGKNADFVFTEAKDYPGAYRISGTYEQKDNQLVLKYVLIKDKLRKGGVKTFTANYKDANDFALSFVEDLKLSFKR